jgi:hypothetical protein
MSAANGRVSALYVQTGGTYFDLPHVDPWDERRDARKYAGPHPVVAHPPCQRWGKFWFGCPLTVKRTGVRKVKGDDGGCFESALDAVRLWGGILEHPWGSHAWPHFGLAVPPRSGGVGGCRQMGVDVLRRTGAIRPLCTQADATVRGRNRFAGTAMGQD